MKNIRFAFRMLKRNPLLVYVSIPGLAIGICAVLLLAVYLKYELSFDKSFKNKNRIVRTYSKLDYDKETTISNRCARTFYTQLPLRVPEIEKTVQLGYNYDIEATTDKAKFKSIKIMFSDPEFFDVFGIKLIRGNTQNALNAKNQIVLTESAAKKMFSIHDCLGKTVEINNQHFIVAGVMPDLPKTTHFNFEILAPHEDWLLTQKSLEFTTYYLIKKGVDIEKTKAKILAASKEFTEPWSRRTNIPLTTYIENLKDIHLFTKVDNDYTPTTNPLLVKVVAVIAIFILLISIVNFVNMFLLHGEKRIAEISSRKSLGATSSNLATQFYRETGIVIIIALAMGLFFTVWLIPYFSKIINIPITPKDVFTPVGIAVILSLFALLVLFSGLYPTKQLAQIKLVDGLKGNKNKKGRHQGLTRSVVFIQFFISILLISSLLIIKAQITHLKNIPLGFNAEKITSFNNPGRNVSKNILQVQDEIRALPFVEEVGGSDHLMGKGSSGQLISLAEDVEKKELNIDEYRVYPGFCETMELELIDGHFFTPADTLGIVLNETAAKKLGFASVEGKKLIFRKPMNVIAIVKDFYFSGYAAQKVEPLMLTYAYKTEYINVKSRDKELTQSQQAQVVAIIKKFNPAYEAETINIADLYQKKFTKEDRIMKLVSLGSIVVVALSFMGLLAMSIMTTLKRTKEIGIRKVMGSSEPEVIYLLIKQTLLWVCLSSVFALVLSYFTMEKWLSNYYLKINLSVWYFIGSAALGIGIAMLAVGWQSWRAATRNPVEALRYE